MSVSSPLTTSVFDGRSSVSSTVVAAVIGIEFFATVDLSDSRHSRLPSERTRKRFFVIPPDPTDPRRKLRGRLER